MRVMGLLDIGPRIRQAGGAHLRGSLARLIVGGRETASMRKKVFTAEGISWVAGNWRGDVPVRPKESCENAPWQSINDTMDIWYM